MKRMEAEDMLRQYKIQDWPHMKEKDRARIVKSLEKVAFPDSNSSGAKKVTNEELKKFLGSL